MAKRTVLNTPNSEEDRRVLHDDAHSWRLQDRPPFRAKTILPKGHWRLWEKCKLLISIMNGIFEGSSALV
ncbi:hypothetical protein PISMIDRAFT_11544 [Pisolithus microcarpus 441]|uniref:Uncharacterized protein n=1 Tax=Pisolithus microcarpus 441 TaxID=765257 RepID=A0A0C9YCN8_9AGAM|nr:hypothetical protein PISMIDRAFT_11544 [Pisolithus microcarpus 441]